MTLQWSVACRSALPFTNTRCTVMRFSVIVTFPAGRDITDASRSPITYAVTTTAASRITSESALCMPFRQISLITSAGIPPRWVNCGNDWATHCTYARKSAWSIGIGSDVVGAWLAEEVKMEKALTRTADKYWGKDVAETDRRPASRSNANQST
jgi:hypothetical protein